MPFAITPDTPVAVIGAGSMGAGIALVAAQAGHAVRLHDASAGAADAALGRIAADLAGAVKRGKLDAAGREAVLGRITVAASIEALAGCGLAVEAIVERLDVKQSVFAALEAALGPEALLASNTSSISITAIAQGLSRPGRVAGWHFFNPPARMRLVEVIAGVETDGAVIAALHALSATWGKTAVDAPNAPGFIVNRVARPYYAEGLRLLAERAASAATLDALLRGAGGFALGPFELMDLIGLDVNLSVTESVHAATGYDGRYAPHVIQQELVRARRLGRKSGRGFHAYGADAAAPAVDTVAASEGRPAALRAPADAGLLQPLLERLRRAGVAIVADAALPGGVLAIGEARLALTDGRTAAERGAAEGGVPWIALDLARDYASATHLGAAANGRAAAQLGALAGLLAAADLALIGLADVAGLAVMRTVCCLANEAADVMTWSGTTARDIDTSMVLGTAYPVGPLAWADALGAARVGTVLGHLQAHYGDARYRRAPALSRLVHEGGRFHG